MLWADHFAIIYTSPVMYEKSSSHTWKVTKMQPWIFFNLIQSGYKNYSKSLSLEAGNKTRVSAICTCVSYCVTSPGQFNKEETFLKSLRIGKEELKLTLFEEDMIVYLQNPKEFATNYKLISAFRNVLSGLCQ